MDAAPLIMIVAGLSLIMALAWAVQRLTRNSGWVDVIWSLGVGAGGVAAALLPDAHALNGRRLTVGILIALWSLRLAGHIARRASAGEDDPRYAALAQQWGKAWPAWLFGFLQVQAAAAFILVVAVRAAAVNPAPFPAPCDFAGVVLLILAVTGEAMADAQLARFVRQHRSEKAVCDIGLWRWSRHPNYFFEWLGWCAWAVMAIGHPLAWLAFGAPVLMYVLLVHVSGIPPLEAHMLKSRGPAFEAYKARTNAFFPGPVKSAIVNKDKP